MASKTEIANLALSHLGVGKEIGNLDTEKTEEAVAMRRFYESARDATLRDFPWPFATRMVALALVASPPTQWWTPVRRRSQSVSMRRAERLARLGVARMLIASLSHTVNGCPRSSASTSAATK